MSAVSHYPFQRSWDREARAVIALPDGDPATRVPRGKRILHASTALSRSMLVQGPSGSFRCRWPPPLYKVFQHGLVPRGPAPRSKNKGPVAGRRDNVLSGPFLPDPAGASQTLLRYAHIKARVVPKPKSWAGVLGSIAGEVGESSFTPCGRRPAPRKPRIALSIRPPAHRRAYQATPRPNIPACDRQGPREPPRFSLNVFGSLRGTGTGR